MDGEGFLVNDYWKLQTGDQNDVSESGMINEENTDGSNSFNGNVGSSFTCDLCSRVFGIDYNLKRHTPTCKKLLNEQREILQLYFNSSPILTNDVTEKIVSEANISVKTVQYWYAWYAETQNRESQYVCNICGKHLSKPANLRNHLESHERKTIDDKGNPTRSDRSNYRNTDSINPAPVSPQFNVVDPANVQNKNVPNGMFQNSYDMPTSSSSFNTWDNRNVQMQNVYNENVRQSFSMNTSSFNTNENIGQSFSMNTSSLNTNENVGQSFSMNTSSFNTNENVGQSFSMNTSSLNTNGNVGQSFSMNTSSFNPNENENVEQRSNIKKNQCHICLRLLNDVSSLKRHIGSHERNTIDEKGERTGSQQLSSEQKEILIHHFETSPYIHPEDASMLANQTKLTVEKIKSWFKGRRERMKKKGLPLYSAASPSVNKDFSMQSSMPRKEEFPLQFGPPDNGSHMVVDNISAGTIDFDDLKKRFEQIQMDFLSIQNEASYVIQSTSKNNDYFQNNSRNESGFYEMNSLQDDVGLDLSKKSDSSDENQNEDHETINENLKADDMNLTQNEDFENDVEKLAEFNDINETLGKNNEEDSPMNMMQNENTAKDYDAMQSNDQDQNMEIPVKENVAKIPVKENVAKIKSLFEGFVNLPSPIEISDDEDDDDYNERTIGDCDENIAEENMNSNCKILNDNSIYKKVINLGEQCDIQIVDVNSKKSENSVNITNYINEAEDYINDDDKNINDGKYETSEEANIDEEDDLSNDIHMSNAIEMNSVNLTNTCSLDENIENIQSENDPENIYENISEDKEFEFNFNDEQLNPVQDRLSEYDKLSEDDGVDEDYRDDKHVEESVDFEEFEKVMNTLHSLWNPSRVIAQNIIADIVKAVEDKIETNHKNTPVLLFSNYHLNIDCGDDQSTESSPTEEDSTATDNASEQMIRLDNDNEQLNIENNTSVVEAIEELTDCNIKETPVSVEDNFSEHATFDIPTFAIRNRKVEPLSIDENMTSNDHTHELLEDDNFKKESFSTEENQHLDVSDSIQEQMNAINDAFSTYESLQDEDQNNLSGKRSKRKQMIPKNLKRPNLSQEYLNVENDQSTIRTITSKDKEPILRTSSIEPTTNFEDIMPPQIVRERRFTRSQAKLKLPTMPPPQPQDLNISKIPIKQEKIHGVIRYQQKVIDLPTQEKKAFNMSPPNVRVRHMSTLREKVSSMPVPKDKVSKMSAPQDNVSNLSAHKVRLSNMSAISAKLCNTSAPNDNRVSNMSVISAKASITSALGDNMSAISEKVSNMSTTKEIFPNISMFRDKVSNMSVISEKVSNISAISEKVSNILAKNDRVPHISGSNKVSNVSVLNNISGISISKIPTLKDNAKEEVSVIAVVPKKVSRTTVRKEQDFKVPFSATVRKEQDFKVPFPIRKGSEQTSRATSKTTILSEQNLVGLGLFPRQNQSQNVSRTVSNGRVSKPKSSNNGANLEMVKTLIPNNVTITQIGQHSARTRHLSHNSWASNNLALEKVLKRTRNPSGVETKQKLQQLLNGVSVSVL